MIAVFLRGELDSGRYGERLRASLRRDGRGERTITEPDLAGVDENAYRRRLLDEHRAYERREGLFAGFPRAVDWHRAVAGPDEVLDVLYINWDWWIELSGGTRRPRDAAARIRRGEIAGQTAEEDEPLLAAVGKPLIVAATTRLDPLVLVEGHVRLTAFALFPERLPPRLELLVGVSDEMTRWCQW
jgi:hypothetical protein